MSGAVYSQQQYDEAVRAIAERKAAEEGYLERLRANESLPVRRRPSLLHGVA